MAQCTAKSKQSGVRCRKPVTPGFNVCVMHGSRGGAPKGSRNAMTHGVYETLIREQLPEAEREAYDRVSVRTDLEAELRVNRFKMLRLMGEVEQNLVAGHHVQRIKADDLAKIDAIVKLSDNIRKIVKDMQGDDLETTKAIDSFMAGVHTVREMAWERDLSE